MKVRSVNDLRINRTTIKELLKPVLEFIVEHEDEKTRAACFAVVLSELTGDVRLTPADVVGTMMGEIHMIHSQIEKAATLSAAAGINITTGED